MNNANIYFGIACYGIIVLAGVLIIARAWYVRKDRTDSDNTRRFLDSQG